MRALLRWTVLGLVAGLGWVSLTPADDTPARAPRPDAAERKTAMKSVLEKRTVLQDRGPRETPYLVFFLEYWDKAGCDKACTGFQDPVYVFDRLDEFATVLIKLQEKDADTDSAINKVVNDDNLRWADDGGVIGIPPPSAQQLGPRTRDKAETIVHGGAKGLSGKGVIIAVIDSGIDFRHPDFIGPDGNSRLLYFWDTLVPPRASQGQPGPIAYFPGGPMVGTLFGRDDLNRYLKSGNADDGPADEGGHGTACAGVAAGNGTAWQLAAANDDELKKQDCRGVAPGADLIAVRIGRDHALPNAWMLNAIVSWLDKLAGDRPLVISCSFGGQDGGHDASLVEERQLSRRMPPTKPGRAVCIAAGNEATDRIHASETISKDQPARFTWQSRSKKAANGRFPESMQIYIDGVKVNDVQVKLADGTDAKAMKPFVHGVSNARVQTIATAGSGSLTISTTSATPIRADLYYTTRADDKGPMGELINASNGAQVGTPATSLGAITVGSYDFNDILYEPDKKWYSYKSATGDRMILGSISGYSNAGYLRSSGNGKMLVKPDVVAPGQWHVSPACPASVARWTKRGFGLDSTKRYALFNGTSAATPYTAGIIALLMEKKPTLSADEFRSLIQQCATHDSATEQTPNPKWGYGKLDLASVEKMIDSVK
jgi:subtilisin family serine protease